MVKLIKFSQLFIILSFLLFLSGCEINNVDDKLRWLDDKIGQGLNKIQKSQVEDLDNLLDGVDVDKNKMYKNIKPNDLTKDEKEKIDEWLENNNLNRYGDPRDTIYIGGTPLFDEAIGQNIDRFDYIFKKHPDLLYLLQ